MLVRVLLESNPNFSWFANQFFDQLNLRAFKLKLLKEMAAAVTYLTSSSGQSRPQSLQGARGREGGQEALGTQDLKS